MVLNLMVCHRGVESEGCGKGVEPYGFATVVYEWEGCGNGVEPYGFATVV